MIRKGREGGIREGSTSIERNGEYKDRVKWEEIWGGNGILEINEYR